MSHSREVRVLDAGEACTGLPLVDGEGVSRAVVWPESLEDVARLVALANTEGLALVPYGAGSGVCGGRSTRGIASSSALVYGMRT